MVFQPRFLNRLALLLGGAGPLPTIEGQVAEAEGVLLAAIPKREERYLVLDRLLRTVSIAEAVAPADWGATLLQTDFASMSGPSKCSCCARMFSD